jgi:hypothetical protein
MFLILENGAATYGGYYSGFDTKPKLYMITSFKFAAPVLSILKANALLALDFFNGF